MDSELLTRFTYHPPQGNQPQRYVFLRNEALVLAELIDRLAPGSRERSLAFTALEEAVMWANAAIARRSTGAEEIALPVEPSPPPPVTPPPPAEPPVLDRLLPALRVLLQEAGPLVVGSLDVHYRMYVDAFLAEEGRMQALSPGEHFRCWSMALSVVVGLAVGDSDASMGLHAELDRLVGSDAHTQEQPAIRVVHVLSALAGLLNMAARAGGCLREPHMHPAVGGDAGDDVPYSHG